MKPIPFQKWQGAGNDFVIIDNRTGEYSGFAAGFIKKLCDRHFGIGADGLMLIGHDDKADFRMSYFNSDGYAAEMCGNGGRCIVAMAYQIGICGSDATFVIGNERHEANLLREDQVRLRMIDVDSIEPVMTVSGIDGIFLNTGVPHLVVFYDDIGALDVSHLGRQIRFDVHFAPAGTNVNFVKLAGSHIEIRTYERGVEAETLACGTGNVAAAIAAEFKTGAGYQEYLNRASGGVLKVFFNRTGPESFRNVYLEGPAVKVFEGTFHGPRT